MIIYPPLKTAILVILLLFQFTGKSFPQAVSYEAGNFTEFPFFSQNDPEMVTKSCSISNFNNDDKPDYYPNPGFRNEIYYWLVPVLRYFILIEKSRLEIRPGSENILIAFSTVAGLNIWNALEMVLRKVTDSNETTVGDPTFIFSEPCDGGGISRNADSVMDNEDEGDYNQEEKFGANGSEKEQKEKEGVGGGNPQQSADLLLEQDDSCLAARLNRAIHVQDIQSVAVLLNEGASPDELWQGEAPLFASIHPSCANIEICQLLLSKDANPNINRIRESDYSAEDISESPLAFLISEGCKGFVDKAAPFIKVFLEFGGDCLFEHQWNGSTLFLMLLMKCWNEHVYLRELALKQVRESSKDLNKIPGRYQRDSNLPLLGAIADNPKKFTPQVVHWLLDQGADPDIKYCESCSYDNDTGEITRHYVTTPLAHFLRAEFWDREALRAAELPIILLIKAGADCLAKVDFKSPLFVILSGRWDEYVTIITAALQQVKEKNIDLNLLRICVDSAGRRFFNVNGLEVDSVKTKKIFEYIWDDVSDKAIPFLIAYGWVPCVDIPRLKEDFDKGVLEQINDCRKIIKELEKYPCDSNGSSLLFRCLIKVTSVLSCPDDIDSLNIPQSLKDKLHSEPYTTLIKCSCSEPKGRQEGGYALFQNCSKSPQRCGVAPYDP